MPASGQALGVASGSEAARRTPTAYVPGEPLTVTLAIYPGRDVHAYALEDAIPSGWDASNVNDGGEYDAATGKVKWGPLLDTEPRMLSYEATPSPAAGGGTATFGGVMWCDGVSLTTTGVERLGETCRVVIASQSLPDQQLTRHRLRFPGRLSLSLVSIGK